MLLSNLKYTHEVDKKCGQSNGWKWNDKPNLMVKRDSCRPKIHDQGNIFLCETNSNNVFHIFK